MTGSCSFFSLTGNILVLHFNNHFIQFLVSQKSTHLGVLFYESGNRFQLEASVSLNHKKKSLCKRIIGFQVCSLFHILKVAIWPVHVG